MTARKDPTTDTPAIASKALTWWKYDTIVQQAECGLYSVAARGMDAFLSDDAWSAPEGACRVKSSRLKARAEKDGLDAGAIWRELVASGRWVMSEDRRWLIATHLRQRREEGAAFIELKKKAGEASGAKRRAAAEKKRRHAEAKRAAKLQAETENDRRTGVELCSERPDENPDDFAEFDAGNSHDDNDLNRCSTPVRTEHSTEQSRTDLLSEDHVLLSSVDAACHAEGAAAPPAEPVAPRRVPNLRVLMVEEQLRDTVIVPGWMDADTAALVRQLAARGTLLRVEVERAIGRLYAPLCGPRTPQGHVPLRDEIGALLRGEAGRDGRLPVAQAPEAVICALFGALTHRTPQISPLLFRAIAIETAKAMAAQPDADGRELAADITHAFDHGGRQASGYLLAPECTTPTRLNGYPTKSEATA
jgi:hypothetical protein